MALFYFLPSMMGDGDLNILFKHKQAVDVPMTLHIAELMSGVQLTIVMFLKLTKCHSCSPRPEGGSIAWLTVREYLWETMGHYYGLFIFVVTVF